LVGLLNSCGIPAALIIPAAIIVAEERRGAAVNQGKRLSLSITYYLCVQSGGTVSTDLQKNAALLGL